MSEAKLSDFVLERLNAWGADTIYGYSGDGINGLLGALGRASKRPRFIQPAHEELCALMAAGHAKYNGGVGVCLVTQGPGAVHALNGLYDAKLDHQPVVALVGAYERAFAAKRPFLIEAVTDPNAPPLPPELTQGQKKKLEQAFKQADPDVPPPSICTRSSRPCADGSESLEHP